MKRYRIRSMPDGSGVWFYIQKRFLFIAWKTIPGLFCSYSGAVIRLDEIMKYETPRYF